MVNNRKCLNNGWFDKLSIERITDMLYVHFIRDQLEIALQIICFGSIEVVNITPCNDIILIVIISSQLLTTVFNHGVICAGKLPCMDLF